MIEEIKEQRKELVAEKRKRLIERIVLELSQSDPDLYYRSASEIARQMQNYIEAEAQLNANEIELLQGLDHRDMYALLSMH